MLSKNQRVVAPMDVPAEDIGGFPGFRLRRVAEPTVDGSSQMMRINHDTVAPGGGCHKHLHRISEETWFILSGAGHFFCDGKLSAVKKGDILYAEKGATHQIINSGKEDLVFLTVTVPPCDLVDDVIFVEAFDYKKQLEGATL